MGYFDKAKSGAEDSRTNGGDSDDSGGLEGIEVDFDEVAFVRQAPTTFMSGVFPEGEGNPVIRFRNAQYNDERLDQGYLGLVLDDAEAIVSEDEGTDGTILLKTDDNDSTDYRVFDETDHQTKVIDGMGVKFGDRLYEGEVVEEVDEDRIILTVSGASSKNVAKRLDKKGGMAAGMDEETGGVNDGLIEYKPNDQREGGANEYTSRYARDPELKEELYGARVGVFLGRREELDDAETDEGEDPSYRERVEDDDDPARAMYWYVLFNIDTEEEIEVEVTDQEIEGYSWLDDEWDQFDPSVGGIPDDQWTFVENFVEAVENGDVTDTSEENIRANIEEEGDFDGEAQTDSMVNAITNRV